MDEFLVFLFILPLLLVFFFYEGKPLSQPNPTTTTGTNGRLGNQIIRNLAVSHVAKKHDLKVNYFNHALIEKLGIDLYSGNQTYSTTQELNDQNYFSVSNGVVKSNLNPNNAYFQTKDITNVLYTHIQSMKDNIMKKNPFKERYNANHDLFVHIRLTDVAHFTPGLEYYLNGIQRIPHDNLYLSTDQPNHPIVKTLLGLNAKLIEYDEIATFQYASTCKHVLLSHGSFSAMIGYLSFFSDVYYPEYDPDKIWYGDMFSIEKWTKLKTKL
jgi:hypothetical protein